jgi:hypothetical protein
VCLFDGTNYRSIRAETSIGSQIGRDMFGSPSDENKDGDGEKLPAGKMTKFVANFLCHYVAVVIF